MITCPLCGCEFDETAMSCVAVCPMAAIQGCSLLCCPNCGFQMVDERKSKLARVLRKAFKKPADFNSNSPKMSPK